MNTYKGNFTPEDKELLNNFDGYTFWMIDNEYSITRITIYGKHAAWDDSQRIQSDSVHSMYMNLHIARMAGYS